MYFHIKPSTNPRYMYVIGASLSKPHTYQVARKFALYIYIYIKFCTVRILNVQTFSKAMCVSLHENKLQRLKPTHELLHFALLPSHTSYMYM